MTLRTVEVISGAFVFQHSPLRNGFVHRIAACYLHFSVVVADRAFQAFALRNAGISVVQDAVNPRGKPAGD